MKLLDLTPHYMASGSGKDRAAYMRSAPWFFEHYFHYWSRPESDFHAVDAKSVVVRARRAREWIDALEKILVRSGIPGCADLTIVLLVGCGTSNGHAFRREDGSTVVWLALESYSTNRQTEVFVTHEILHGLHYAGQPEFAFRTVQERLHLGRQFLTEGMATYVTQKLLGVTDIEALWADYISVAAQRRWSEACEAKKASLFEYVKQHWDESRPEEELFYANDATDEFKYRGGYFAGRLFIEKFALNGALQPAALLKMGRHDLETAFRNAK